ncbi:hypothetical protein GH714_005734 [Hevea brasiliensis]|uniref:Uncharacterized protein n=1 Tax=Hevea brasiliensis TaxID=3981 RepID=A0A6A6KBW7_HEVBR|nr:hypothetical protein GH714_005734 [Hevea brasiliensis]
MTSEVSSEDIDLVTNLINEKLRGQFPHVSSNDRCIFRVPKELRRVNEKAYEPRIIAIGPYHHGKEHLIAMVEHKIRYLLRFLQRRNENDVSRYVQIIEGLEERARRCYAEPLHLTKDAFIEMMLLGGCFIVEFIWKLIECEQDPVIGSEHVLGRLMLDLLLLENQLPFFIFSELLVNSNVRGTQNRPAESNFIKIISFYYESFLPGPGYHPDLNNVYTPEEIIEIKNLLGLLRDHWKPSPERMAAYQEEKGNVKRFTRCATELREAEIKLKSVEGFNLFDINFERGIIKIPKIKIADKTECVFRNAIAYEQLTSLKNPYFTDYMIFMDNLIDSA